MGNLQNKETKVNTNQNSVLNMNFSMKSRGEPVVTMNTILKKIKNPENTIKTTVNPENSVTPENNATQNGTINDHDNPDLIQKAEKDPFFEVPIDDGENIFIRKDNIVSLIAIKCPNENFFVQVCP